MLLPRPLPRPHTQKVSRVLSCEVQELVRAAITAVCNRAPYMRYDTVKLMSGIPDDSSYQAVLAWLQALPDVSAQDRADAQYCVWYLYSSE